MADVNEIRALQASFRGAVSTAAALQELQSKVDSLDPGNDVGSELLAEAARVTAAHAVASAALRGLVEMMIERRGRDSGGVR
jgi:hypothetical protein